MIYDKKGVSKNFLAILLILAIIISVIGTYVSLTSINNVPTQRQSSGYAYVGVGVMQQPQIAQVGVNVIQEEGENNG